MQVANVIDGHRSGLLVDRKYRLLRPLGEGAMGCVWLAWHETLELPVALKISKPESEASSRQEAHLTATLRHPSIVAVLDSGRTPFGHGYFAMEFLDGSTLSDVLRRDGPLSVRCAVTALLPLLDALEHCHERGVVHRDLKPDNVFFSRAGDRTLPKLLDFGVAASSETANARRELVGTPGYMAPEQAGCMPTLDHRADLWAFCAILYEAVAGEPAIRGQSCDALLLASIEPMIAPLHACEASRLWPILERGLRARPEERFQSASELRDALRALGLDGVAPPATEQVRPRRHVQWGPPPGSAIAATIAVSGGSRPRARGVIPAVAACMALALCACAPEKPQAAPAAQAASGTERSSKEATLDSHVQLDFLLGTQARDAITQSDLRLAQGEACDLGDDDYGRVLPPQHLPRAGRLGWHRRQANEGAAPTGGEPQRWR